MRPWVVEKIDESVTSTIISDIEVSAEVIYSDRVSMYGRLELSDGLRFFVKYYINENLLGTTAAGLFYSAAVQFQNSLFACGENFIRLEIYDDSTGDHIFTYKKEIIKNYYDAFYYFNFKVETVKDIDFTLHPKGKLFIGAHQENVNFVLSEMSIRLYVEEASGVGDQVVKLSPILEKWEAGSGLVPKSWDDVSCEITLNEGENIVNLAPLLISGKPVYGIAISGENISMEYSFQKDSQAYYLVYVARPRVVLNDRCTISWEDLDFKFPEAFEKFELSRDGDVVFSTENFDERSFTDTTLELNKTYLYQLKIYVKCSEERVWDFTQAVADLWVKTDKDRLEFYEDHVGIHSLPINVYADITNPEAYTDFHALDEGFYIENSQGENIYKEFFVDGHIDFTDRVTITQLLADSCMDKNYVQIVEDATFVKNLGEGKLWRFKMRKRTRVLEYQEKEES